MPKKTVPRYPHRFDGEVVALPMGGYNYTVVYLPEAVAQRLPLDKNPRLRVTGEINGKPFAGACQPQSGRWYFLLSKRTLREVGAGMGDVVKARFRVADQDAVETPEELRAALDAVPETAAVWKRLTPGKRRGFAHMVASAKRPETRQSRVRKVMKELAAMGTPVDPYAFLDERLKD